MDKFADSPDPSVPHISALESYKGTFSKEEFEEMFVRITDQVCGECESVSAVSRRTGSIHTS